MENKKARELYEFHKSKILVYEAAYEPMENAVDSIFFKKLPCYFNYGWKECGKIHIIDIYSIVENTMLWIDEQMNRNANDRENMKLRIVLDHHFFLDVSHDSPTAFQFQNTFPIIFKVQNGK